MRDTDRHINIQSMELRGKKEKEERERNLTVEMHTRPEVGQAKSRS